MNFELNERVKSFQKSTGLNTADFAQKIELQSASVLYNAFRGRNRIGSEVLEAIAEHLQPDMNLFFYDAADQHKPTTTLQVAEDQATYHTDIEKLRLENQHLKEINTILKDTIEQQKLTINDLRTSRKS